MNWKLVAGLACGMALLLGACSGNNNTGTSSGTTPPTDQNGGSNGDDGGDGDGGTKSSELQAAEMAETAARTAVMEATAAATTAETAGTEEARTRAQMKIAEARTALDLALSQAEAAYDAAPKDGTDDPALGAAKTLLDRVRAYRTAELAELTTAEAPLFWFTRALVRQAIADGDVQVPKENTNTATIVRTPRTKANAAGTAQVENTAPVPIKSTTFKLVTYASGKKVFSSDAKHSGAETFKVDGYVNYLSSNEGVQEGFSFTGVQLTSSGLVVRFGGISNSGPEASADFPDTRMKLNVAVDQGGTDIGAGGWDLAITFDSPKTFPGAKGVRSWQGNGDFYWKARVRPHASQLSGGTNYVAGQMAQGRENLGVYEVWLSNHIGVDKNLEDPNDPVASARDDENLYLKYAAYGMFVYTGDDGLVYTGYNNRKGRLQSINFGYTAFDDATGKKTTDINKAINATFTGQTIAVAVRGDESDGSLPENPTYPATATKLARGKVSLAVSIPKSTGTGTVGGTISDFEEWDPSNNRWKTGGLTLQNPTLTDSSAVATLTTVHLNTDGSDGGTAVNIADDGTFNGIAKAGAATNLDNVLNDNSGSNTGGVFKGNFYGPRTDSADLEVAGSWRLGYDAAPEYSSNKWTITGSFGAKRQPPASSN